jgi:hypothetical protein
MKYTRKTHRKLYEVWCKIRQRCNSTTNKDYKNYGARGIKVSEEWNTFQQFMLDMGERPEGHSLDRMDNDKGYSKENCSWSTRSQQGRNRRDTKLHTYNGRQWHLQELCEAYDMDDALVQTRLDTLGYDIKRAIEQPVRKHVRK